MLTIRHATGTSCHFGKIFEYCITCREADRSTGGSRHQFGREYEEAAGVVGQHGAEEEGDGGVGGDEEEVQREAQTGDGGTAEER